MEKEYNNILQLKDQFDVFLFDAYGVFWDGTSFFDGAKEVMEKLVKEGKILYILSNTTQIAEISQKSYEKRGLIKGLHYQEIITSGEFCKNFLKENKLVFSNNKNPKKFYLFGKQNENLFKESEYIQVNNMNEADFIYLSAHYFSNEEYKKMSEQNKKYLVELKKANGINCWRATEIEVLMPEIQKIIDCKLPVLNCNPDYKASEGLADGSSAFIITQGSITKVLKENGVEVVEFGKPYIEIFEFTFDILEKNSVKVDKSRMCMIGDTLRTDIKGANNAGIKSILCTETGITANQLNCGESLGDIKKCENVNIDYAIKGVAIGANTNINNDLKEEIL